MLYKSSIFDLTIEHFVLSGQRAQNAAARIVTQKPSRLSSVDTLHELHWLLVQWHTKFKLTSLTFKVMPAGTPLYLSRLLIPYCPSRVLRSSSSCNLLQVPYTNVIFSSCSLRAAAPSIWNSLPDSLRSSGTLHSFRRHLKTHLYQAAFNAPPPSDILRFTYVTTGAL